MSSGYDVIVVGARCAGSPTAMLLAQRGQRVLLVDRAGFPSDTLSTHLVHPLGVAALRRWGLLDMVTRSGCPPIHTYAFDFGDFVLSGSPGTADEPVAYAPRRTLLDNVLVEAAAAAGVEVRTGFTVSDILFEDGRVCGIRGHDGIGGRQVTEHAAVVVGADGLRSTVARAVQPARYAEKPPLLAGYYTYWSGLPMAGRFESYDVPGRGFAAWPTNDDLTVVIGGWPYAEMAENRSALLTHYRKMFDLAPAFAERIGGASMEERLVGMAVPNYFRTPYGPGWALVGDAGYNKDFITAQGIQDAFLHAELVAAALADSFAGSRSFEPAMAAYQQARDRAVAGIYELTTQLATLEPPPPELAARLEAMAGDQAAMDMFARVTAGVESPESLFAEPAI